MKVLSIGAGTERIDGAVHMDRVPLPGIDIVWDLEKIPWPMGSGCWDKVVATDVLEHLAELIPVMDEINRILVKGGTLELQVPLWNTINWAIDPTHKRAFTPLTFDYWCPDTMLGGKYWYYTKTAFKKVSERVQEHGELVMVLEKLGDKREKALEVLNARGLSEIKRSLRKAHPKWSESKVEQAAARTWNKAKAGSGQTVGRGRR